MDNPIYTETTPPPVQPENTPQVPVEPEKPKKKLPKILIVLSIILAILLLSLIVFSVLKKDDTTSTDLDTEQNIEDTSDTDSQKPSDNDSYVPHQNGEITDVSQYTDIKLKNYTGLNLTISTRDENDELQEEMINGIVTYIRRFTDKSSIESINIINKMVLTQKEITEFFTPTANDIKNKNIAATWLNTGSPWILTTGIYGRGAHSTLTEIKNVSYTNTDTTFAVLSLAHGHVIAGAGNEFENFIIQVYALKGDNLIGINSSTGNLMKDIGLSTEDDSKCSKDNTENNYAIYDEQCLSAVFKSGKYDANLRKATEELIMSFELAN